MAQILYRAPLCSYYVRNWPPILHSHQCQSDPIFADLYPGSLDCETFTIIIIYKKTWSWMLMQWRLDFNFESQFQSGGAEMVRLELSQVHSSTESESGKLTTDQVRLRLCCTTPTLVSASSWTEAAALDFPGSTLLDFSTILRQTIWTQSISLESQKYILWCRCPLKF